jgi:hypothetical protein
MRTPAILLVLGLLLIFAAPAAIADTPQPPGVVTGSASQVTGKSAALSGTVTSNGRHTTYTFQYGTTTGYGFQTHAQDLGRYAVNRPVAARLDRLTPGTEYHYRLVATNQGGTTAGSDQTFTTTAAALPTLATGAADRLTGRSATLSGTLSSNGSRTTYAFQYGTTTAYGLQTHIQDAGPNAVNRAVYAHLGRLTAGTAYHYRLVATNDAGTATGSDGTFTTTAVALPSVTTDAASNVTAKSALLSGTLSSNGSHTTYTFQYGTTTAYGLQTHIRDAGPNAVNRTVYAHLGRLAAATGYHYRLVATNAAGTSDGADQMFTTTAVALPTVATGTAGRVSAKSARLSGTLSSNGSHTTYTFQYGTTTGYGFHTHVQAVGPNAANRTVYAHLGRLAPGTAYHYRLVATNKAGTATGEDQTFTTAAVVSPSHKVWFAGSVAGVASSSLTVNVLWTGPHDSSLAGQTLKVSVPPSTRIQSGKHHRPIALGSIQLDDLVAIRAVTDDDSNFSATGIHVSCNCHWIGGTISSVPSAGSSLTVHVDRSGPYDGVILHHDVTLHVNDTTIYLRGKHDHRIPFRSLRIGDGVGIVFAANGFFKAPSFDPSTATFTAKQVHAWNRRHVPEPESDAQAAADTSATG